MKDVTELQRHASPGRRPQPLAFLSGSLWAGSWDTDRLYAINPKSWKVRDEVAAPGRPYGIAALGDELRVVVAIGEDDDRYLFRFAPGKGFDQSSKTPCPEFTGSHLASDGTTLYLTQQGLRRIVTLDENAMIQREIALPTRCGGIGFGPTGTLYMIAADAEFDNLEFATLDLGAPTPTVTPIARIDPDARALAFDGSSWWTSYREASTIVAFTA
jgi:sugar lactone lactonase YvrE